MKNYKLREIDGFTLIELLIAMSIISIISISFFVILNSSIKINKKNEIDIKSMQIAQSKIESIRAEIKSGKNPSNSNKMDGDFKIVTEINEEGSYIKMKLYNVNITVEPPSKFSKRIFRITTKISSEGEN
ncbi:MAG: type IV pilus modification PilV family protein [Paraclostridium sp.]